MKIKISIAAAMLSVSTAAFAADIQPVAGNIDWSGAYVGISAGYVSGDARVTNHSEGVPVGPFLYDFDGGIGAVHAGYNWQMDSFVFGAEASLGYMGSNGEGRIPSQGGAYQRLTLDGGLYGDITGRVGFAFDRAMIYGKGGFAFFNGEARQETTKTGYATTGTDTFTGWTLGAGIAYKLAQNVSLDLSYQHFDFGKQDGFQTALAPDGVTPVGEKFLNRTNFTANAVKIGISYHF